MNKILVKLAFGILKQEMLDNSLFAKWWKDTLIKMMISSKGDKVLAEKEVKHFLKYIFDIDEK